MKMTSRQIRTIAEKYLYRLGLYHWRLTRVHIGIPKQYRQELRANYPHADNGFYACVFPTSGSTFILAVSQTIPQREIENVIAHEISHILLQKMWDLLATDKTHQAKHQLEVVCNRIAAAISD